MFDDIRIRQIEQSAPFKIKLSIYDENVYNYEEAKSDHCVDDYKLMLAEEIKKLRIQNKFKKVSSSNSYSESKHIEKFR